MIGFSVDSEWKIVGVELLEGDAGGPAATGTPDMEARP